METSKMKYINAKEELLKMQVIPQTAEPDFADFWRSEVEKLRAVPLNFERKLLDLPYRTFRAYEVTFNTHDNTKVTGYFCVPCTYTGGKLPCVAFFHGGGGKFGVNADLVSTGVCTFSIDGRSQGGKTYDKANYEVTDDYHGGIMTHGVTSRDNFYMKNLYLDAVRAVDVMASMPEVDGERIVSYGISQGGAMAIVAAALSGKIKKAYPVVPSYSCLAERTERGSGVFASVQNYLRLYPALTDKVMETLSYFDINNMVSLLRVPTDYFLGLADPTCLPPYVYSLYAHTDAPKNITVSPFTGHDISLDYKLSVYREFAEM